MVQAAAGVQSTLDVEANPVISQSRFSNPNIWPWVWFIIAVLVVLGFHVRVFGRPIPPAAQFP